jgi:hypothetical protein
LDGVDTPVQQDNADLTTGDVSETPPAFELVPDEVPETKPENAADSGEPHAS